MSVLFDHIPPSNRCFRQLGTIPMAMFSILSLFAFLCLTTADPEITTEYEWTTVDFDWNGSIPMSKSDAVEAGLYIMENNVITGVKFYKDRVFVTVPRWRPGVPATLNEVIMVNNKPLLSPYPSWSMQQVNNCSAIQYTQSVVIDVDNGTMFILDNGYKYFSDQPESYPNSSYSIPDTTCPPKVIIYDIDNDQLVKSYTFPDSVAAHNFTFLCDIVLDKANERAFISDQFGVPFLGGIVVYNYNNDTSRRFADPDSMKPDNVNASARTVTIRGISVPVVSGTTSIAITPQKGRNGARFIYFAPFSSYRTYRVRTDDVVQNKYDGIEFIGNRTSQVDHILFSDSSNLYFAPLTENAIYSVHHQDTIDTTNWIQEKQRLISKNDDLFEWIDMFAWNPQNDGYLYFTTTRLEKYFTKTMDWNGGQGANMKINKIKIKEESTSKWEIYVVSGVALVVITLLSVFVVCRCIKRKRGAKEPNDAYQGMIND
eukprot:102976_1